MGSADKINIHTPTLEGNMSFSLPLLTWIFLFWGVLMTPQPLLNFHKCIKDPQPLWKSAFSSRTIIQVKNKVIWHYATVFIYRVTYFATFIIGSLSATLCVGPP